MSSTLRKRPLAMAITELRLLASRSIQACDRLETRQRDVSQANPAKAGATGSDQSTFCGDAPSASDAETSLFPIRHRTF